MSRKDEYPKEHPYGVPFDCYVCGSEVGHRGDGENGGRGIFDISERAYHVVHYRCEGFYFRGHTWDGEKTLEEVHAITKRHYFDSIIYFDWLI